MTSEIRLNQTPVVLETKAVAPASETTAPDTAPISPARALSNLISGVARKTAKQIEKSTALLNAIKNTGFTPFAGI